MMETIFTILLAVQFVVVATHDLVDIPGWTHGSQVQAVIGRRKLWLASLINSVFPGIAVFFAVYFWHRAKPGFVMSYQVIYCTVTMASAVVMWYLPYFFGTGEERKRDYARMYSGTRQALPPRRDNPRPNVLHLCFHVLFLVNLILVLLIR